MKKLIIAVLVIIFGAAGYSVSVAKETEGNLLEKSVSGFQQIYASVSNKVGGTLSDATEGGLGAIEDGLNAIEEGVDVVEDSVEKGREKVSAAAANAKRSSFESAGQAERAKARAAATAQSNKNAAEVKAKIEGRQYISETGIKPKNDDWSNLNE